MRCVCGFEGDGDEYVEHLFVCEAKPGEKWDFYITHNADEPGEVGAFSELMEDRNND